jgi:hypothetical protein
MSIEVSAFSLTYQARYVRVEVPRRAMHASCDSPCHLSAKRTPIGYCRLRSRDCSRLLASELDVKVSLHPAQASQRPYKRPVSSHTTCWLHDTTEQSMPSRGREHQWHEATAICHTFWIDSSLVRVPRHRREVSSLARRVMWPPVSVPLQDGLRFFPPPYPHRPGLALRPSYLPCRRSDTGLPRSTRLTMTGEVLSIRR